MSEQTCPLTTEQLVDVIIEFVRLFNAPAGIDLYNYQILFMRRIVESLLTGDGWTITGLCARQSGKSEAISSLTGGLCVFLPTLARAFPDDQRVSDYAQGIFIGVFAPKKQQSGFIYDRVRMRADMPAMQDIYEDPDIDVSVTVSRGDKVAWSNGSFMLAQTASTQSTVEGGTFHMIIIDESQLVGREKIQKEISPMLAATNGSMVKIGTANLHKGDFYDSIMRNLETEKAGKPRSHFEFDYKTVINEKRRMFEQTGKRFHLKYEAWVNTELEKLGGNEDNEEFKLNFRLLWQDANAGAVDKEAFIQAADERIEVGEIRQFRRQVAGIDLGKINDPTVVTVMEIGDPIDYGLPRLRNVKEDDERSIVYYEKTIVGWCESYGRWRDQIKVIIEYLSKYAVDVVAVDATGVGDPVAEELATLMPEIRVVPVKFSTLTKDHLYKLYLQEISSCRLFYAAGPHTVETVEYNKFIDENLALGKDYVGQYITCFAPDGHHDDYPDSAALACYATTLDPMSEHEIECSANKLFSRDAESYDVLQCTRADRYR